MGEVALVEALDQAGIVQNDLDLCVCVSGMRF